MPMNDVERVLFSLIPSRLVALNHRGCCFEMVIYAEAECHITGRSTLDGQIFSYCSGSRMVSRGNGSIGEHRSARLG